MKETIRYVTVDLDFPTVLQITTVWNRMEKDCEIVQGRVSSSGNGVHLRGTEPPTNDSVAEQLRRIYGDDPKRIQFDIERDNRPSQVLFDSKRGKDAGEWYYHINGVIADYKRNRNIKEYAKRNFEVRIR